MICYKLVRRLPNYASINRWITLRYAIDETTVPSVGRIYVFKTLAEANANNITAILKCECSRFRHVPAFVTAFNWFDVIELFSRSKWGRRLICKDQRHLLTDKLATVSWLRPIEVIQ